MPSSELIILVAVVVLIAVVVYGGIRFLRSDDDEEFEDGGQRPETGNGRFDLDSETRGRGRREHDDFDAARDFPRPAARRAAGRDTASRDAAGRDTAGRDAGARRQPDPRREQRGGRGRDDYFDDDRTEL
ncbi:MAG TPA: hypothetical protein VF843_07260, partial [Streptosporangiaceae bacterium]